jgi:hypothetical protein
MSGFTDFLSGAGSVLDGILGYLSGEDQVAAEKAADDRNYALSKQYRGDVLSQQKITNDQTQQGIDLSKQRFSFERNVTNETSRKGDIATLSGKIQQAVQENEGFKNWLINLRKV